MLQGCVVKNWLQRTCKCVVYLERRGQLFLGRVFISRQLLFGYLETTLKSHPVCSCGGNLRLRSSFSFGFSENFVEHVVNYCYSEMAARPIPGIICIRSTCWVVLNHWRIQGAPPLGPISFLFMQFKAKILLIDRFLPQSLGLRTPPPGWEILDAPLFTCFLHSGNENLLVNPSKQKDNSDWTETKCC